MPPCHIPQLLQEPPNGFLAFTSSSKKYSLNPPYVSDSARRPDYFNDKQMDVVSYVYGPYYFLSAHAPHSARGLFLRHTLPISHICPKTSTGPLPPKSSAPRSPWSDLIQAISHTHFTLPLLQLNFLLPKRSLTFPTPCPCSPCSFYVTLSLSRTEPIF